MKKLSEICMRISINVLFLNIGFAIGIVSYEPKEIYYPVIEKCHKPHYHKNWTILKGITLQKNESMNFNDGVIRFDGWKKNEPALILSTASVLKNTTFILGK